MLFAILKKITELVWPFIADWLKLDPTTQNWHNEAGAESLATKKPIADIMEEVANIPLIMPKFSAPVKRRRVVITSKFGWRVLKWDGKKRKNYHTGVDLGGSGNVYAIEDSIVQRVLLPDKKYPCRFKWTRKGWKTVAPKGRAWTPYVILIGKVSKTKFKYKHVKSKFKVGQSMKAGQVIGKAGNLGFSMGGHLHLEIWPLKGKKHKSPVDPIKWLKRRGVKT